MGGLTHDGALRWTRVGVLAAFALVLGYLETFIPIPIPGVKLGLANIAILLTFIRLDAGAALFVTLIKVLAQGLLFGSPLTFAYSLTGSLAAFAVMALLVRLPSMHPAMTSVCGAVAHTAGQMLVASALLGTGFVWLAAPLFIVAAVVTGAVCGILAVRVDRMLTECEGEGKGDVQPISLDALPSGEGRPVGRILAGFAVFAVVAILADELIPLAVIFAIAVGACIAVRVPLKSLGRGLRAFLVLLLVSAVACWLSYGREEALPMIAAMALRLGSVMAMSVAVMGLIGTDDLLAFTVRTAQRLEARGVSTQGPMLALNVCLQTLPVLATGLEVHDARLFGQTLLRAIADAYARAEGLAASLVGPEGEERA